MTNDTMILLVNGTNAFPEIIRCIEHAKKSIHINMFIWRDDVIGNRMAEAVLMAANQGVKIYISIDRYGVVLEKSEEVKRSFFHKEQPLFEKIEITALELFYPKNGRPGKVKDIYSPLYQSLMKHPNITISADVFKADHSKYYIIDDEILFVGGINIEDKENGCDINGNVYGDYMVKLCGKEYVNAFKNKLSSGQNTGDDVFFGLNLKKPEKLFEMEQLYLDLINEAKKSIHITMAYFSPLPKFMDALISAQKRGIQITIVVPENANFQNPSNMRTMRKLLKATNGEITVYLSPKMLHTKLMMNENCISLGSTNITKKAFGQLDELNLFVKRNDSPFEKALTESIHNDISESKRITDYRQIKYNRLAAFFESFMV